MTRVKTPLLSLCFVFAFLTDGFGGEVVTNLDLGKYAGLWYEIARLPARYEDGLVGVTASYTFSSEGKLSFKNKGFKQKLSGPVSEVSGSLKMPEPSTPGKLKLYVFNIFPASYWVHELDADYRWALVGGPSRKSLWVFSRTPTLEASIYERLVARAKELGYDTAQLIRVEQK
ncbi:MAG: lipocalin family protein [Spirochaetia bacterium]|nr:lipocalin family protein [Spirochaetia bacterium]